MSESMRSFVASLDLQESSKNILPAPPPPTHTVEVCVKHPNTKVLKYSITDKNRAYWNTAGTIFTVHWRESTLYFPFDNVNWCSITPIELGDDINHRTDL